MNDQPGQSKYPNRDRAIARILMLVENSSYPEDTRILSESESLHHAGYQVSVICPTGNSRRYYENVNGVHVYRYPKPRNAGGLLGYLWEYGYSLSVTFVISLYVALRRGFDVIHMRLPPDAYVLIAVFYKLLGKRYVADLQDASPELYLAQHNGRGSRLVLAMLRRFERLACRTADHLITINETYRAMLVERNGLPADRCSIVRNAPGARFLLEIEPLTSLRERGKVILGYMGMIGAQDRVDIFLRALVCLRDEFRRDDFLAVIVGHGPALDELKRLSIDLGLEPCVYFAGYRAGQDLLRHIASFDIGITPDPSNSYNDGCSFLKLMEYMAMSKPSVAFHLPENIVTAGDAALYAKDNSERDFARQIVRLMDDAELRGSLGRAGRRRIDDALQWRHQEQHLLNAYDSLLSRNRRKAPISMEVAREYCMPK